MISRSVALLVMLAASVFAAPANQPARAMIQDKIQDKYTPVPLSQQKLQGLLADRMSVNLEQRLLKVDENALLSGFQHRPGSHPWIGEHVGKFLHAAANAYEYFKDERLKTLMDRVVSELIKCQLPDGYLGTYSDDKRWTSWDVWVHKYNLIGLLRYYEITGNEPALQTCRRMGDLLCNTFGDGQEGSVQGKDISYAGEHLGMAATSVLEPMVNLYRHTGDKKYLDFCFYITRSIEGRSKVISSLTEKKRVYQTANNKAYEMLSNVVGLTELYRVTGDEKYLTPALNAWQDIVQNRLYISGTTSSHEFFQEDNHLPAGDGDDVGEGCVTVTWMQLNLSLLRLTGESKYADQLEHTVYNALLAAQHRSNGDVCYFTPLMGTKKQNHEINCCLSSIPRGIAMIPLCIQRPAKDASASDAPLKKLDGGKSYPNRIALQRGTQVLCLDAVKNPDVPLPALAALQEDAPTLQPQGDHFRAAGVITRIDPGTRAFKTERKELILTTFADAAAPTVWLATKQILPSGPVPVTFGGKESQSRPGTFAAEGSFTDLRPDTMRSTRNNKKLEEDWFAVEFEKPAKISRIIYRHGSSRPDGGWFDTSSSKPRIEYKTTPDSSWQLAGTLDSYPKTNTKDDPHLQSGQPFELKLDKPIDAVAIRVIGTPSSGARPNRSFATCAELEAYEQ